MKNKYYVYFHIRYRDNVVFYVGKGNWYSNRARSKARSQAWRDFIREDRYIIQVISFETEEESLNAERLLINNPHPMWKLVNVRKDNRVKPLPDSLRDLVEYSEDSPSGLVWKVNVGFKVKQGQTVGTTNSLGYWNFESKGVSYAAHRVIYFLFHGDPGNNVINHIDNNPSNNKISNLEAVTIGENNRKSKTQAGHLRKNNSTGINGISYQKRYDRFTATVYIGGLKLSKSFSIGKHGKEGAINKCEQWLTKMRGEGL